MPHPFLGTGRSILAPPAGRVAYYDQIMQTPGLVGYWRLGDLSGTVAVEEKNGRNGTYNGNTLNQGGALTDGNPSAGFDGVNDFVSVPDHNDWDLPGDFTVECWARHTVVNTGILYMGKPGAGPGTPKWTFMREDSRLRFHINDTGLGSGENPIDVAWTPIVDTWYHLVCTRIGNNYAAYANTVLLATGSNSRVIPVNANALQFGMIESVYWLNGRLDEPSIVVGNGISAAQVLQRYNAGIGV